MEVTGFGSISPAPCMMSTREKKRTLRRKCEEVLSGQTAGSVRRYVTLPQLFFPISRLSPRPRCSRQTLNPPQELSRDAVTANGRRISGGAAASGQSEKPSGAQKLFPSWQQRYLLGRSKQQEDIKKESGSHSSRIAVT